MNPMLDRRALCMYRSFKKRNDRYCVNSCNSHSIRGINMACIELIEVLKMFVHVYQ